MSWLNYLNAIDGSTPGAGGGSGTSPSSTSPPNGLSGVSPTSQPGFLSDELRAQLEAWTTVNFDDVSVSSSSTSLLGDQHHHPSSSSFFGSSGIAGGLGNGGGGIAPSGDGGGPAVRQQQQEQQQPPQQLESILITNKPDPSPYSKRPFGHFQNQQQYNYAGQQFDFTGHNHNHNHQHQQQLANLQRSFNAFAATTGGAGADLALSNTADATSSTQTSEPFASSPSKLFDFGIPTFGAVDGSNTLFATPASPAVVPSPVTNNSQGPNAPSADAAPSSEQPSTKKRRTASSSVASTPSVQDNNNANGIATPFTRASTPAALPAAAIAAGSTPKPSTHAASSSATTTGTKHIPLTKAAILAAQAAELAAQKVTTEEEEAARQAELNRIAAEDDKRRRNTAASARFRVKKKQREAALEDNVRELTGKIERLEKELESTRNENNFLRDLVIKKIGGASSSSSSSSTATSNSPPPPPSSSTTTSIASANKTTKPITATGLLDLPIISQPLEILDGARRNGSDSGKISGGLNGATGMGTLVSRVPRVVECVAGHAGGESFRGISSSSRTGRERRLIWMLPYLVSPPLAPCFPRPLPCACSPSPSPDATQHAPLSLSPAGLESEEHATCLERNEIKGGGGRKSCTRFGGRRDR